MLSVVLQINVLDPTYPIENDMYQSMVISQVLLLFYMVYRKVQSLVCLFLIYINDLNQAIKFCKVHHFADYTNFLHFNKSVAKLNKFVNQDMKNLTVWLNASKILNVEKTEKVIFKHQRKKLDTEIKIKLNRKRLYPSQSVRYLGIKIDQNLNWKDHINDIAVKLNRANALLFKIRNFVNIIILKTIYFAIFDSHINYANLVCAQNSNAISRILTLHKRL